MIVRKTKSANTSGVAAANSAAVVALGWYLFCRFFYLPFPGLTVTIFQSWFPALDLSLLWSDHLLGQFLIGAITFPAAVWISVFAFMRVYRLFGE